MPSWRATSPCPTRFELFGTVVAAVISALTTPAFSQASNPNPAVANILQPHSVRTLLRNSYEETSAQALRGGNIPQGKPQDGCLAKASAADEIAACHAHTRAAGQRRDVLAPDLGRRAEAHRL
jgi:hypothetical protein